MLAVATSLGHADSLFLRTLNALPRTQLEGRKLVRDGNRLKGIVFRPIVVAKRKLTRLQSSIWPHLKPQMLTYTIYRFSLSFEEAAKERKWIQTMDEEIQAIEKNATSQVGISFK